MRKSRCQTDSTPALSSRQVKAHMVQLGKVRSALRRVKQSFLNNMLSLTIILGLTLAVSHAGVFDLTFNDLASPKVVGILFEGESFIGGMLASLATIIAIYFSISILAVQYAAGNYTASILERYKMDRGNWLSYSFLLVGLLLSAYMLSQRSSLLIFASGRALSLVNFGFVLLVFSFLVLAIQFVHIFDLVNPRVIIGSAKKESLHEIRAVPARLDKIRSHAKPQQEWELQMMQTEFFRDFLLHENQGSLLKLTRQRVLQIVDIIQKCAMKRESETYVAGLQALSEICESYVAIRKDDSTPGDEFIESIYERLLDVSKVALDNEDLSLLQMIMTSLERVGIAAIGIKRLSPFSGPNQVTTMAIWHIHALGVKAVKRNLWDGAAQAVLSIRNIGIQAIRQTGNESLASNRILHLGKGAIAGLEWHLTNISLSALSELLFQSVLAKTSIYADPTSIMEAIEQLGTLALDRGLNEFALIPLFAVVSQTSLGRIVHAALKAKNEEYPIIETAAREGYAKEVVSRLLECIHKIGLAASKNNSPLVLHNIFDCVAGIMDLLLKEKFTTAKDGFREELLEAIDTVSNSYIVRSGDIHPWFVWGGEDTLTNLAFATLSQGQDKISTACEKSILAVSNTLIELDKHGYDSPRLASRIAVIGVYALHRSNKTVAQECANDLAGFDKKYVKHSPSPHPMLHIQTMHRNYEKSKEDWRRDKWEEAFCQVTEDELKSFEALFRNIRRKLR